MKELIMLFLLATSTEPHVKGNGFQTNNPKANKMSHMKYKKDYMAPVLYKKKQIKFKDMRSSQRFM